jgi:hypothetical protein
VLVVGSATAVACVTAGQPTAPPPTESGTTTVTDGYATTMWGAAPLPGEIVAVGDDGVLAVVATNSGERTAELARFGRPGRGRPAIAGVTVAPDGDTAWFDVRRSPGDIGRIYHVPTDGSSPAVQVASGSYPDIDPTGELLAFAAQGAIEVHGVTTDVVERFPATGRLTHVAWTRDGNDLVWIRNGVELVWLDRDGGGSPRVVARAGPGETLRFPLGQLSPGSVSVAVSTGPDDLTTEFLGVELDGEPTRRPDTLGWPLDRSFSPTWEWGLRVTDLHRIRWSGSGGVGTVAEGYIAADF